MPKEQIALWFLNRVVGWAKEPKAAARLADALGGKFEVHVPRRTVAPPMSPWECQVNARFEGAPGELMHEGSADPGPHQDDEYFVPFPFKCVGDPDSAFWQAVATPSGLSRISDLKTHLRTRFNGHIPPPGSSKPPISRHFGSVRLNLTDPALGYYRILHDLTARTGAKNVLVGYSQGGTVARYLAFIDEHVVKESERCIHGIITVQAPNRGSPVASVDQKEAVAQALLGAMLSLPKWLPDEWHGSIVWDFLATDPLSTGFIDFINRLLDAELDTFPNTQEYANVRDGWLTARKWLSGLSGRADLAFADLNPAMLGSPGSVLHAIAHYPLAKVRHGAVIGANNRLDEFVRSLVHENFWLRLLGWFARRRIRDFLWQAGAIYKRDGMAFPAAAPAELARDFAVGVDAGPSSRLNKGLDQYAHDFVIPSVSQMLVPSTPSHLGNWVNEDANHLSGAELWDTDDGITDFDLVAKLLRQM